MYSNIFLINFRAYNFCKHLSLGAYILIISHFDWQLFSVVTSLNNNKKYNHIQWYSQNFFDGEAIKKLIEKLHSRRGYAPSSLQ